MRRRFIFIGIIIIVACILFFWFLTRENIISKNNMELKSNLFEDNKIIPPKYTCDGKNISPELSIKNIPQATKELVLIVDDPDAPSGLWTHWIVWNIPLNIETINEGELPDGAIEGTTSFGTIKYSGPCPPKGTGVHRYFFRIYALDKKIDLPSGSTVDNLKMKIDNNSIVKAELVGLYGHEN